MSEVTVIAVRKARIITTIGRTVIPCLGSPCRRPCDPFLGTDPLTFKFVRFALFQFFAHALPLIDDRIVVITGRRRGHIGDDKALQIGCN